MRGYLKEKVAAPVQKAENTAIGIRRADHAKPSTYKKLALTLLTSGGLSVGIVRWQTEATEFFFPCLFWITFITMKCFKLHTNSEGIKMNLGRII
jgi:hypothetical protein